MQHPPTPAIPLTSSPNSETFQVLPVNGEFVKDSPEGRVIDTLPISAEVNAAIVANSGYARTREIPVDVDHALYKEARDNLTSERNLDPETVKALTFGHVTLSQRPDGSIWANIIDLADDIRQKIQERAIKFCSPVIWGLGTDDVRISSVSLTNYPALRDIEPIILTATPLEAIMEEEKQTEGTAAEEAVAEAVETQEEIAEAVAEEAPAADPIAQVAAALGLDPAAENLAALILGAIAAMQEQLSNAAAMSADLKASRKAQLLAEGKASGKLAGKVLEWAEEQDAKTLSAFLEKIEPVIPLTGLDIAGTGAKPDEIPATPEQSQMRQAFDSWIKQAN